MKGVDIVDAGGGSLCNNNNYNIYLVGSLGTLGGSLEGEIVTRSRGGGGGRGRGDSKREDDIIESSSRGFRRRFVGMPDGARNNGISETLLADSSSSSSVGGEDEEDEDRLLKKSFNHAFIFDLFRAAVDGKMLNGSRKWNSTGPRDADCVMLVLNQKLKENEELTMLLDRLKSMGVPCIFFSSSDLRSPGQNGSVKSASASLDTGTQHNNGVISSSPSQAKVIGNGTTPLLVSPTSVKSPASSSIPEPVSLPSLSPVDLNNHLEDLQDQTPSTPPPTSPPTHPVVTPIENEIIDTALNSSNVTIEDTSETSSRCCPTKAPKTKRKRRRKYPYLTKKPVKRKIPEILKEPETSPLKIEIPSISPSAVDDPYAFTPEDDDDEDLSLELLHSPKKRKKNGLPKEASLNRAKAAVIARVFGDISCSLSPSKDSSSSEVRLGSPDIITTRSQKKQPPSSTKVKTVKRRKKAVGNGRKRKVKGGKTKAKVQKTKSCVQEIEEKDESLLMISNEDAKEVVDSSLTNLGKKEEEVIKTEEDGKAADLIDPCEPVKELEVKPELSGEKDPPENEPNTNRGLPDFLSLFNLKPKNDAPNSAHVESEEASPLSPSTATESTKCPTFLEPNTEEAQQVISSEVSTGVISSSSSLTTMDSASELTLTGVELPPEIMMPPPPPPPAPISKDLQPVIAGTSSDQMTLRRPSFYALIAGNVRNNMENFLDGKMPDAKDVKPNRRRKRAKNGFLLHHGDNFPEDPEAPYKLHLATQILLKLNKRRAKFKPKEDKGKSLLSYLKLVPKRVSRGGKGSSSNGSSLSAASEESQGTAGDSSETVQEPYSVFSGEWVQERNFICNVCGHVEGYFWDMVMHKGEIHPGVVVTHVELPDLPPEGFRVPPPVPDTSVLPTPPPACTKCQATFNTYPDLHRHIFECAGNLAWLEEPKPPKKKKSTRKKGFKRRFSNSPRKKPAESVRKVRTTSEVFKCEFCTREFKTEGWLKNHVVSHSLPISIPLSKLNLPPSSSSTHSSRRSTIVSLIAASKSNS